MLIACWSAKGGSGTTVVSVALAACLARRSPAGAVVADLAGDVPAVLGLPEPEGPGLREWLAAGDEVPADALRRIEVAGPHHLGLLAHGHADEALGAVPTGERPAVTGRGELLAALLGADPRPVVVDCGLGPSGPGLAVAAAASVSLLVIRPCYLALRRAMRAPVRPSGVVLVDEPGRSLGRSDVEDVLGVPVRAVVSLDPAVARAVDAGLVGGRVPRSLDRALRHAC